MLHLTKISQTLVNELFGLKIQQYDFVFESIQFDSDEVEEFEELPQQVLGNSLDVYNNEKLAVSIQILTNLSTSKIFGLKIQKYNEGK